MLENFDDLKKLWQSCEKRILELDHIPAREAALEKACDKMENKIKFAIGVLVSATLLVVTIVIYGYVCGWYAIENENETKVKDKKQSFKDKEENKTSAVEDDIITKDKSFENLIVFPNGTIIDKRVLEKELHLKHLENMKKIYHDHEIEKHSNELKSKEITTISTVSVVSATVILVGLMFLGYNIVSKKRNKAFAIKQIPALPITPGNQERLLSANTKENKKQLEMEIGELEDLGGKLEKEIDDRKKFWAELQILKNKGSTSSKLIDEIQNLETEMNSKEEELNKVKQKKSALDNISFGLPPIGYEKRNSSGMAETIGKTYGPPGQKTMYSGNVFYV